MRLAVLVAERAAVNAVPETGAVILSDVLACWDVAKRTVIVAPVMARVLLVWRSKARETDSPLVTLNCCGSRADSAAGLIHKSEIDSAKAGTSSRIARQWSERSCEVGLGAN